MKQTFTVKETFSQAWQVVKSQIWVLAGLVIGYTIIAFTLGLFANPNNFTGIIVNIITYIIGGIFSLGYLRNIFQALDGEEPQFSAYGQESRKVLKFIVANILMSLIVFIGLCLLVIPGIYLAIRLQFYTAFIVDEDSGIIESMKQSWRITKGSEMPLFILCLAMIGIGLVGVILLGVGLFIAIPVCWTMFAIVYRKLNSPLSLLEVAEAPEEV